MLFDRELTYAERARGRALFLSFSVLNGISFTCIADNVLTIFALKSGCPDYLAVIIASFSFWSNIFVFTGKYLVAPLGAARTIGVVWMARNILAVLIAASPLISAFVSPSAGICALTLGALGFFVARSGGVAAWNPVIGEITGETNRGYYSAQISRAGFISCLGMMAAVAVVTKLNQSLWVYQIIILTGAFFGFASTRIMFMMPEGPAPRASAGKPLGAVLAHTWRTDGYRRMLFSNCVSMSGIMLSVPVAVLALKEGFGVSDSAALVCTLIQLFGGVLITYVSGTVADKTGARPLIVIYYCGLWLICLMWFMSPHSFNWLYHGMIFLLGGAFSIGLPSAQLHYSLSLVPPKERVGVNLCVVSCVGLCAGLAGSVAAAGAIKWLKHLGAEEFDVYKIYFGLAALALVCFLPVVLRLKSVSDWSIRKSLKLLFAPRDIQALFIMSGVEKDALVSPEEESAHIQKLQLAGSDLAEGALISALDSPHFMLRGKSIMALGGINTGPATESALIDELLTCEFSTAHLAAQILGEKKSVKAIPALRKQLLSEDVYLRGKCMVALVQLGDKESFPKILEMFEASSNPRMLITGATALSMTGDSGFFGAVLRKASGADVPVSARAEMLWTAAGMAGKGDAVYLFLKLFSKDSREAALFMAERVFGERPELSGVFSDLLCGGSSAGAVGLLRETAGTSEKSVFAKEIASLLKTTREPEKLPPEFLAAALIMSR